MRGGEGWGSYTEGCGEDYTAQCAWEPEILCKATLKQQPGGVHRQCPQVCPLPSWCHLLWRLHYHSRQVTPQSHTYSSIYPPSWVADPNCPLLPGHLNLNIPLTLQSKTKPIALHRPPAPLPIFRLVHTAPSCLGPRLTLHRPTSLVPFLSLSYFRFSLLLNSILISGSATCNCLLTHLPPPRSSVQAISHAAIRFLKIYIVCSFQNPIDTL